MTTILYSLVALFVLSFIMMFIGPKCCDSKQQGSPEQATCTTAATAATAEPSTSSPSTPLTDAPASPLAVTCQFLAALKAGELEQACALTDSQATSPEQVAEIQAKLLATPHYLSTSPNAGQADGQYTSDIIYLSPDGETTGHAPLTLTRQDTGEWRISNLPTAELPSSSPITWASLRGLPDQLASFFMGSLASGDSSTARSLILPGSISTGQLANFSVLFKSAGFDGTDQAPSFEQGEDENSGTFWCWLKSKFSAEPVKLGYGLQRQEGKWYITSLPTAAISALFEGSEGGYNPILTNASGQVGMLLYFDHNADTLTPLCEGQLALLAQQVMRNGHSIEVHGHADNAGDPNYNMQLSARRAQAVADKLVELGVRASKVQHQGHGIDAPLYPYPEGASDEELAPIRTANRRVETYIIFE